MLTINVEDSMVKVTSIRGTRVVFAAEAPLQADWVHNGVVLEKAHVSQVISMLLAQYKIRDKETVASVSGLHSIYRVIYVPKLNRALLAEAAKKEMARAVSVPLSSIYTAWSDVKISENEIALCLLGLPFDNVNSITETVKLCGLRLKYLELKPLAVSRVIDEKNAIVVNVRPNTFDVTIVNNSIPEMIRHLQFSSGNAISDGDKARMVKEEVDRTVNFYNSSHPNNPLGPQTYCIVSGMFRETLSMVMGYPVKSAPALLTYPPGTDDNEFIVNSGLALRTINRLTRVDINVMPSAAPAARTSGAAINPSPLIALGVCAVLAVGMWIMSGMAEKQTADLQLVLNQETAQLSSLQRQYRGMTEQAAQTQDVDRQLLDRLNAPIKYLADQRGLINRNLGQAFASLPATIYLTSVSDDGGTMLVQGSAPSEEILLNYARDLRNSGLFKLVLISSVSTSTYTEVAFTLQLTVNQ
ncbi:MAG: PilN domain-containing protein [Dehalococcoidia bacterium]|nr:PilN domain-containing protein [Dehalococcoidia bacterium]